MSKKKELDPYYLVMGHKSLLNKALVDILNTEPPVAYFPSTPYVSVDHRTIRTTAEMCVRLVVFSGAMLGKRPHQYSKKEMVDVFRSNCIDIIEVVEQFLTLNEAGRVCIVGSASAEHGSYDTIYAASKAAIHAYVRHRRVKSTQQLVAVAPTVIRDAGMTRKRPKTEIELLQSVCSHFLPTRKEVAAIIMHLLWGRAPCVVTNTVVELNAGRWTR